jgi:hypothetical protein
MELLDYMQAGRNRVELLRGDLTDIPPERAVDLLVISAFPNDFRPTPTSLVGALHRKGLSVEDLARAKEEDLRESFSCWLSREFDAPSPGLRFRRILCFEPLGRGEPPELVGDIYRALVPILGRDPSIRSIAMPIVAAGNQSFPVAEMLPPLLDATLHWLESGLPLEVVRIVAFSQSDAAEARVIFKSAKEARRLSHDTDAAGEQMHFDVFISYAHEDREAMQTLETELLRLAPDVRIFLDRNSIDVGSAWQPAIFESLDQCRKVVALFSPAYLQSKVCKEEFNIAWVRSRESDQEILFPLYLFKAKLPTYMKYRLYVDCREGDSAKLRQACSRLLKDLGLLGAGDAIRDS